GLAQSGVDPPGRQLLDVLNGALRGLSGGDQPGNAASPRTIAGPGSRRIADQPGQHRADGIIGAARRAGADTEIAGALLLGVRRPSQRPEYAESCSCREELAPGPEGARAGHRPILPVPAGYDAARIVSPCPCSVRKFRLP